ncbi:hypothetical protein K501DRAFT_331777 [Backusella circina FSU 941]|nr:hypothetical protein K501DRAFT_331777 [Backusella circina FSU 941]
MTSSESVSIVTAIVTPSPQISQSSPTITNSTVISSSIITANPSSQTSPDNQNSIATNVNSIVGIVVALGIASCLLFVGALYIVCRARRRRQRQSRVIKAYGQDFSDPVENMNETPILIKKIPIIQEPTMAKINRRNLTHSTATSVSRYSTIIQQIGPSSPIAIPESRLARNKKYNYF